MGQHDESKGWLVFQWQDDGMYGECQTWDDDHGVPTTECATISISGAGYVAKIETFRNSAEPISIDVSPLYQSDAAARIGAEAFLNFGRWSDPNNLNQLLIKAAGQGEEASGGSTTNTETEVR